MKFGAELNIRSRETHVTSERSVIMKYSTKSEKKKILKVYIKFVFALKTSEYIETSKGRVLYQDDASYCK